MLDQGLELHLPTWLIEPMAKPNFKQFKGYFLFDAEPKIMSQDSGLDFDMFLE